MGRGQGTIGEGIVASKRPTSADIELGTASGSQGEPVVVAPAENAIPFRHSAKLKKQIKAGKVRISQMSAEDVEAHRQRQAERRERGEITESPSQQLAREKADLVKKNYAALKGRGIGREALSGQGGTVSPGEDEGTYTPTLRPWGEKADWELEAEA